MHSLNSSDPEDTSWQWESGSVVVWGERGILPDMYSVLKKSHSATSQSLMFHALYK